MVSAHYYEEKIHVYLCENNSLKDLILQQGNPIYTDSVFAGFIKQSLLKCPQIAHGCLAPVTATIRSLLPLTGFHSSHIMSSKVQSAMLYLPTSVLSLKNRMMALGTDIILLFKKKKE